MKIELTFRRDLLQLFEVRAECSHKQLLAQFLSIIYRWFSCIL